MKKLFFSLLFSFLFSFLAFSSPKPSVELFLIRTYQYEGGSKFTDTKFDGHYTKFGIILPTLEVYYNSTGRGDIDQDKKITWNDIRLLNWDIAVDIYRELYWKPGQGDNFKSQRNANLTVDFFVNSGFRADFIKYIQKLSGAKQDGVIGIKTVTAINQKAECIYFNKVIKWRKNYYALIVKNNPQRLGKLLNGLNNRLIKICKNENYKNDTLHGCDCLPILQPKDTRGKNKRLGKARSSKADPRTAGTRFYRGLRDTGHDSDKIAIRPSKSCSRLFVLA